MEQLTRPVTNIFERPSIRKPGISYTMPKRIADRTAAALFIMLSLPFMIVIALLIKLGSRGPVLFNQTRIGQGRRPFTMYKFRTMCVDAEDLLSSVLHLNEETSGMLTKIKADPRITGVGRILRAISMDELPQLLNVLKGDMSLVGPRPPLPSEVALYNDYHMRRLEITPGLTGLWQISGRKNTTFEDMVNLDLSYTERRGLMLDLYILLKTIPVVLKMNGAR